MTKVEELREGLVKTLVDAWGGHHAAAIAIADNIISASHAEGVAEGVAESESYRRTHVGLEWDALPVTVLEEGDYVMNRQGYRGFVESVKPIESMNDTFVWVLDEHNPDHHCAYEGKSLKKIPSVLAPKEKP
jgi:hypothetical protein